MTSESHVIKVLLVGDGGIGKTSLARTMTEGGFPAADSVQNTPDTCQIYHCNKDTAITAGDDIYNLEILDPSDEDAVKLHLGKVDFYYFCFDVADHESYTGITTKWLPLVTKETKPRILLVGLKRDLAQETAIIQESGRNLAKEIGATSYVEISSLKYIGIEQLKEKTVFEFVKFQPISQTRKRRCIVM